MLADLSGKRVLLLQGPAGPFFRRVADHLRRRGSVVSKVNFNAGEDLYYSDPDVVHYRGDLDAWPSFFESLVSERGIEAIVLFGDCRPLHRVAIERAPALGVEVFVFEEGYLRPDFVTLERNGVNGYSGVPKDPEFYRLLEPGDLPQPARVKHAFAKSMIHTICYATTAAMFKQRYPEYRHHRDIRPFVQAGLWLKSGLRRALHTVRDHELDQKLQQHTMPPFFFVPLQVHLDSQMNHSPYSTIDDFIIDVVRSFARHARPEASLLLKHHPMDRPYRDYTSLVAELRYEHALGERLLYADVINIPAALRSARGTIVINSTVGLSSIHHGTPVKCLGSAVYDMPGLTHQGTLEDFWQSPGVVDHDLYERFRYWLRTNNQLNGSVWSDLYE